jgi:hypothetical protein
LKFLSYSIKRAVSVSCQGIPIGQSRIKLTFSHELYFLSGSKRWIITSAGGGVGARVMKMKINKCEKGGFFIEHEVLFF